jgi:hypothetical protein
MREKLALARPYLLILTIVTVGRFLLGVFNVPYESATDKVSILIATLYSTILYGAFTRRWLSYRLPQAVGLAMLLGLSSQVVILLATVASYALGLDTYFNHPRALNQEAAVGLGQALVIRLGGLVGNTITSGIAGALGWAMGGMLPTPPASTK